MPFVKLLSSLQNHVKQKVYSILSQLMLVMEVHNTTHKHTLISFDFSHKTISNISPSQLSHFFIKLHIVTTKTINDGITFKTLDASYSPLRLYTLNNVKCRFTI
jgi:hypothetical protein